MTTKQTLEELLWKATEKIEAQAAYIQTLEDRVGLNLYTEEELKLAIEYACGYQKAECYQEIGGNIFADEVKSVQEADEMMGRALDYLSSSDNISKEITIEEVNEYIKSKK